MGFALDLQNLARAFYTKIYTSTNKLKISILTRAACTIGEIKLRLLHEAQESGSVTPLKDWKARDSLPVFISNFLENIAICHLVPFSAHY